MINAIVSFIEYLGTSVALLGFFVYIYARATPYKEFALIAHDNIAVAVTFVGAVLGFTIPMLASIYYTHSLVEMVVWAAITCVVQLAVRGACFVRSKCRDSGHSPPERLVRTIYAAR